MPNFSITPNFEHEFYGGCTISKIDHPRLLLQSVIQDPTLYKTIAYEVRTKTDHIGTIGLIWEVGQDKLELFHQFKPDIEPSIVCNVLDLLVDGIFKGTRCPTIIFNSMVKHQHFASLTVSHCGFLQLDTTSPKYQLTRFDRALLQLTRLIHNENLMPNLNHLVVDLANRASTIWYKYFLQGTILLSIGGVRGSLLSFDDLDFQLRIRKFSFNTYNENNHLPYTREEVIHFLIEERALSGQTATDHLSVSFCLGSHEGFMRVARCIYDDKNNNAMFVPVGAYGLLATGLTDLKPAPFSIHLVNVTHDPHEKIKLSHLEELTKKYPLCKTLFIDVKTTTGSIYTTPEMSAIIDFCKQKKLFLVIDTAHLNMGYSPQDQFPDAHSIAHSLDFHDFIILYTASKTYGLERGRVGFIVFDRQSQFTTFERIDSDLSRVYGTVCEVPILLSAQLLRTPVTIRRNYVALQAMHHRYNMNLMLAYIQGINSSWIDEDLREAICAEIPLKYQQGISTLHVYNKPRAGLQMKVDTSLLYGKYFGNIHLFNAEMLTYALMLYARVVTLHAYQILDPGGFSIRLSYAFKEDVHQGMQRFHDFLNVLHDSPTQNRFMPGIIDADTKIFTSASDQAFKSTLCSVASQKARFFKQVEQSRVNPPFLQAKL